jgi:hypothetical protein
VTGRPLPDDAQVYWLQGFVDAYLEYPVPPHSERLAFHTRLITLAPKVTTSLRLVLPDGTIRALTFVGDAGRIWLDPAWYQTAIRFLSDGILFVLTFPEQWLLAACLLVGSRRLSAAVPLACFGVGQFASLLTVAYGPDSSGPWLPAVVALVISALLLLLSIRNVVSRQPGHRWSAFGIGSATGVASAIFIRDILQFAGRHPLTAHIGFAAGVQAGEMLLFGIMLIPIAVLTRVIVSWRLRTIIVSALVATVAWNALTARIANVSSVQWPVLTAAGLVTASSWLLVLVAAAGVVWLVVGFNTHSRRQMIARAPVPEMEGRW